MLVNLWTNSLATKSLGAKKITEYFIINWMLERIKMHQIFIDKFIIPESSLDEFSERMNYNREFIKKISGFVQDKVYKSIDEQGNSLIITIAEWEDELSLTKAKELVQNEYKRINFNPPEFMSKLNVKMERGTYQEIDSY